MGVTLGQVQDKGSQRKDLRGGTPQPIISICLLITDT